MSIQTAHDEKTYYQQKLGNDFGELYYHAHNEWANVKIVWQQYQNLFGHSKERVDLLNNSGAGFFARVEQSFLETVMMGICRLSDPKKTSKHKNISVNAFLDHLKDPTQKSELEAKLEDVEKAVKTPRKWRDKRIAHNDFDVITGVELSLPETTIKEVNDAIDSLFEVFSHVSLKLMQKKLSTDIILSVGNELFLLQVLQHGVEALVERRAKQVKRPKWFCL